jgi:DNA-binding winged helix-turn-helix (wHTH) protein/predicted Zn-dependent protease
LRYTPRHILYLFRTLHGGDDTLLNVHLKLADREPAANPVHAYRFGEFRLDIIRGMLFRGAEHIPLPERVFQILLLLIEARGKAVSRDTIASKIWRDCAVADGNIAQHIYLLRKILGERAKEGGLVMTVNRTGYRFRDSVTVETYGSDSIDRSEDAVEDTEPDAFREYCHASYLVERRTAPALSRAIEIFESILRASPHYVPALIGIARANVLLAQSWYVPPSTAFRKARRMVETALAAAPMSAAARAVLSDSLLYGDWNWTGAKLELDIALRSDPNSWIVRNSAVGFAILAGEFDWALSQARRAVMTEPSSLSRQLLLGRALLHAGQYQSAITCFTKIVDSDERLYVARRYRAQALLLDERPEEALAELLLMPQEPSEDRCFRLPLLGKAYADCGDRRRAEQIYEDLLAMSRAQYVVHWNLAIVSLAIGRAQDSLDHLEQAQADREPAMLFLRSLPWFEKLADREGFKKIRQAATLPSA